MRKTVPEYDKSIGEIDIRGICYEIYLYPLTIFDRRYPNCLAQVEEGPSLMRFCEENLDLVVIKHELFHCYMASCFLTVQPDTSCINVEEVACEIFATFSDKITEKSRELKKMLETETKRRSDGARKKVTK